MEKLAGICVGLAALGALLVYDGWMRFGAAGDPNAMPRSVTLSDLINEAPPKAQYVKVSDYEFGERFVEVKGESSLVGDALIPALDTAGRTAVFRTHSIGLVYLGELAPVEGLARMGSIEEPGRSELKSLTRADLSNVLIFDMHAKPTPAGWCWSELGLGVLLIAPLSILLAVAWYWDHRQPQKDFPTGNITASEAHLSLLDVLKQVRILVARPGNNFTWSGWSSPEAALAEIDDLIAALAAGRSEHERVAFLFLPTGPLQDLALSSGWHAEYKVLAGECAVAIFKQR